MKGLGRVTSEVRAKGYSRAADLLKNGLAREDVRAIAWNVSSFLRDEDMVRFFGRNGC